VENVLAPVFSRVFWLILLKVAITIALVYIPGFDECCYIEGLFCFYVKPDGMVMTMAMFSNPLVFFIVLN